MTKYSYASVNYQNLLTVTILSLFIILSIPTAKAESAVQRPWVEKQYDIKGGWDIVQRGDQTVIRFNNNFKTKNGPDLKVFLSKQNISNVNGNTATHDAVLLGALKSPRGEQEYVLPKGISVKDFQAVLIHCEKFSVLWGGGAI